MVHKSSLLPGISKFIDENVLAHYAPTSIKRIILAGAVSLYLKQNEGVIDNLINNPLIKDFGIVQDNGMINIELLRDTLKAEIDKAGFMRVSVPMVGDIDFTTDDVDALYKFVVEANTKTNTSTPAVQTPQIASLSTNGGVY